MRKKILYIHHGQGLGGAPLSLLYLIEGLNKDLFESVVLFLKDSEVVDLYKSRGIQVFGPLGIEDFPHTKIWWCKWYNIGTFLRVVFDTIRTKLYLAEYWLKKINPDIVHLNTSSLIDWGKVADKLKIPVAWHVREPLARGYLGARKKIVQKHVDKYASLIFPISKNDGLPWKNNSKTHVIYNAVDPVRFDVNKIKPTEFVAGPKILFLGGLSKEKGTLVIFEVFKRLLKVVPEARLLVAGYFDQVPRGCLDPKYYLPAECYKRDALGCLGELDENVILLGAIKNVPSTMLASDVIVFPATVGHFARPIIEAGFMKRPVIASNLAPLDELVIDGKTGFLIDYKKTDLWVDKLRYLLENKDFGQVMGNEAYRYCTDKFSLAGQVETVSKYYLEVVNGK